MSCPAVWLTPEATAPSTNTAMDACTRVFLLNRSASLPQIGVVAVVVRRVAVTTHVYWVCDPCTAPMIFGSALETTVLLRVDTNSASSSPLSAFSTLRRAAGDVSVGLAPFTAVLIRRTPSDQLAIHHV